MTVQVITDLYRGVLAHGVSSLRYGDLAYLCGAYWNLEFTEDDFESLVQNDIGIIEWLGRFNTLIIWPVTDKERQKMPQELLLHNPRFSAKLGSLTDGRAVAAYNVGQAAMLAFLQYTAELHAGMYLPHKV